MLNTENEVVNKIIISYR